jgi:hypothetical protein
MHRDWVKGGGSAKGNFWLDSALKNRKPDPGVTAHRANKPCRKH